MAFAAAVGPLLGGAFAQLGRGGWRWLFWINLPLTAMAGALMLKYLQLHNPHTHLLSGLKAIDWLGTILVTGSAIMLQLGLQFGGGSYSWLSATVLCLLIFSAIGFVLFVTVETMIARIPVMPTRIIFDRSAAAILTLVFVHGFFYVSCIYYLPLYFQLVLGASAVQAGVWTLIAALTMPATTLLSGIFINRTGRFRPVLWVASTFMVLTPGLSISFSAYRSWPRLIVFQLVGAVGLGPLFQVPLLALQATVRPEDTAAANSLVLFMRTLASAVGLMAGQTVLQNSLPDPPGAPAGSARDRQHSIFGFESGASGMETRQQELMRQLITKAFRNMWIMYTAVAAFGLLANFFIGHRELLEEHADVQIGLQMDKERNTTGKTAARKDSVS